MAAKPSTASLKQLTNIVNQAVKLALERHPATATANFVINPGVLAGPILDSATNIQVAQQIAQTITAQVQQAGGFATAAAGAPLQSGVLITPNHIICGFYPAPPWELNTEQ